MTAARRTPAVTALAGLVLLIAGCVPTSPPSQGSDLLPEPPAAGAPLSEADGTRADPHAPETTIESATLEYVIGQVEPVSDETIAALDDANEPAPDGHQYVAIPITVTYAAELEPGTTPTLIVGIEDADERRFASFDEDQPDVRIDGELPGDPSSGIEVGDTVSFVDIVLVEDEHPYVYLGVLDESVGFEYVTAA